MRFGEIEGIPSEDTTDIVTKIVEEIDVDYQICDIIRSHRVGNPK